MEKYKKNLVLFTPTIEDGGVEKNLYILSKFLSLKFSKVYIITANNDKVSNFSKDIIYLSPQTKIFNNSNRIIKSLICFYYLLKLKIIKKKIIIFSLNNNILGIIFARIINAKIVIRSNTSIYSYCNSPLKKFIFKFFFNVADKLIVNSKEMLEEMKLNFAVDATCIYNPLNLQIIEKKKNEFLIKKYYPENFIKILSIGRLVKQKNHLLILKSLKKIPLNIKYKLLIIGDGEEKASLENFINQNSLQKNIQIINFQKNIYPFLNKTDIFILSSNYEGLPNVLLEALALKKIIFSTNCPTGPREILKNGEYGTLFPTNDNEALSNLIINFNKNRDELQLKAENGYKSLSRFDFDTNCKKYLEVIKDLDEKKN